MISEGGIVVIQPSRVANTSNIMSRTDQMEARSEIYIPTGWYRKLCRPKFVVESGDRSGPANEQTLVIPVDGERKLNTSKGSDKKQPWKWFHFVQTVIPCFITKQSISNAFFSEKLTDSWSCSHDVVSGNASGN